jgi:hypothetical protein
MTLWLIHLKVVRVVNEAVARSMLEFLDYKEDGGMSAIGPASHVLDRANAMVPAARGYGVRFKFLLLRRLLAAGRLTSSPMNCPFLTIMMSGTPRRECCGIRRNGQPVLIC